MKHFICISYIAWIIENFLSLIAYAKWFMVQIGIHKLLCALIYIFPFYRHRKIRFLGSAETFYFVLKSRLQHTLYSHSVWILSYCHHDDGLGVLWRRVVSQSIGLVNTIHGQKTKYNLRSFMTNSIFPTH